MTRAATPTSKRCTWCGSDPLYVAYHDLEWGVPELDDEALFEKLILDGFQAGLSWLIVLRKREHIREAFDHFDPERVARYSEVRIERLLSDPNIIRNRAKVRAAVGNAQAYLRLRDAGVGFADLLWSFTGGLQLQHRLRSVSALPTESTESRAMARELKSRGFRFCGPTICYAFMQAVGMINDHVVSCFRHDEVRRMATGRATGYG